MDHKILSLRVDAVRDEAAGIRSFHFVDEDGGPLPAFTAGAHIDLHLANGLVRSYSLYNDPANTHRYEVAVARDPDGRGGSVFLCDHLRVGDRIGVGMPRNHFPLSEDAARSVLFAGGIGVTPILAMVRRLEALGRRWTLHYAARSRSHAAFLDLFARYGDKVRLHFDEEAGRVLDMAGIVDGVPGDAHLYCCGPKPMLAAFVDATASRDPETVHLEYFSADIPAAVEDGGFRIHLARSNRSFEIAPGMSILDTLLQNGFDIPYSCAQGTCGECEVKVLAGIPDHRDVVLSKKKRSENTAMMICCSRAKAGSLTLDL